MPHRAHRKDSSSAHAQPWMTQPLLPLVPHSGIQAVISATKEVIEQPIPEIAKDLGKHENSLTAYDVLMFTFAKMPVAVTRATFEAAQKQMMMWMGNFASFTNGRAHMGEAGR